MSKNEKINYLDNNNNQEDVNWFENYEMHTKTKPLEKLRKEDVLNYIKDVEQNFCLEISSGNEDYAGTKYSSDCSVRYTSLRKNRCKVKSKKNKIALKEKKKQCSNHNVVNACNHFSAQTSHYDDNTNLTVGENLKKEIDNSAKPVCQHSNLSRISYECHEFSPTFYGWYSRKNHKIYPKVTNAANFEVIEDRSRNVIRNYNTGKSNITAKKSAKLYSFQSLHKNEVDELRYTNIWRNITPNEKKTKRNSRSYNTHEHKREIRRRKLNKESDISDFENQPSLNKIYPKRDAAFRYQAPSRDREYKERYISGYRYPVKKIRQPTLENWSSRSNRLMTSETNSLLQRQTLRRKNKVRPLLKTSSSIMGTSINGNYQRETNRKNNTYHRRQKPNTLGYRESLCYCRPSLLGEFGKPCKVASTYEDKQWIGCCSEDAEPDEIADCSRYCHCSGNTNDFVRLRGNMYQPIPMSERIDCKTATFCSNVLSESIQLRDNNEESLSDLSTGEDLRNEDATIGCRRCTVAQAAKCLGRVDDKLTNDFKSNQREVRKKIIARYPTGEEFFFPTRTFEKPASGDSSGLRYDAAEPTCECKEPFYDTPAVCLIGSCTCIGIDENAKRNNSDLSRKLSDTYRSCCCSCSSCTFRDEKDPVKKLESFCERVKAVNQDILREPSTSTYGNTMRTNTQEYTYVDRDEQNQSEFNIQEAIRRARSIEREWLTDPVRLRLEKPKRSHGEAKLNKILIYPPQGEVGPPLTLYKRSSNISCRVKGDADIGFRYSVTYVQKFVSPTWMPNLSEIFSWTTAKECDCSTDYG